MTSNNVELFEVFKIGSSSKASLQSLPLETVQKKFLEIVPITSKQQLENSALLATLPNPNHVLVDRTKFQQMFKKEAHEAAVTKSSAIINSAELAIEKLKKDFEDEVKTIHQSIHEILSSQLTESKIQLDQIEDNKDKDTYSKTEVQDIIKKLVDSHNNSIEKMLSTLNKETTTDSTTSTTSPDKDTTDQ
eukprot:TRINITY_DN3996_c1_g4_i1.p1 TRINITY_DN3996_c1_g4~~TRINITY_DN3996_c1_g4_i1.p1  ORF type:complete len:190 (+),score=47.03 TRINITY_DN3996_c1_g4_i1:16-585(+)